jgi:uncharacterized transporter YbjL
VLAFASTLVTTDRADVAYATTYPGAVVMKIILAQVLLALLGAS